MSRKLSVIDVSDDRTPLLNINEIIVTTPKIQALTPEDHIISKIKKYEVLLFNNEEVRTLVVSNNKQTLLIYLGACVPCFVASYLFYGKSGEAVAPEFARFLQWLMPYAKDYLGDRPSEKMISELLTVIGTGVNGFFNTTLTYATTMSLRQYLKQASKERHLKVLKKPIVDTILTLVGSSGMLILSEILNQKTHVSLRVLSGLIIVLANYPGVEAVTNMTSALFRREPLLPVENTPVFQVLKHDYGVRQRKIFKIAQTNRSLMIAVDVLKTLGDDSSSKLNLKVSPAELLMIAEALTENVTLTHSLKSSYLIIIFMTLFFIFAIAGYTGLVGTTIFSSLKNLDTPFQYLIASVPTTLSGITLGGMLLYFARNTVLYWDEATAASIRNDGHSYLLSLTKGIFMMVSMLSFASATEATSLAFNGQLFGLVVLSMFSTGIVNGLCSKDDIPMVYEKIRIWLKSEKFIDAEKIMNVLGGVLENLENMKTDFREYTEKQLKDIYLETLQTHSHEQASCFFNNALPDQLDPNKTISEQQNWLSKRPCHR